MNAFEASVIVGEQGRVLLAGVPFAPGTEVEVTVREKVADGGHDSSEKLPETSARMRALFARVQARNTEPIGPLRREDLYDRKVLR